MAWDNKIDQNLWIKASSAQEEQIINVIKYEYFYKPQKKHSNINKKVELYHSWAIIDKATMYVLVGFQ